MNPKVHEPGHCFDSPYGENCSGIATYGPDPFQEEINGDSTPVWLCEGVRIGSAMDI